MEEERKCTASWVNSCLLAGVRSLYNQERKISSYSPKEKKLFPNKEEGQKVLSTKENKSLEQQSIKTPYTLEDNIFLCAYHGGYLSWP